MFFIQSACINGTELDTPEADCLPAERDAAFCQQILDIPEAEVEAIVEPDGIGNDIGRDSVSLVGNHELTLAIPASQVGDILECIGHRQKSRLKSTFDSPLDCTILSSGTIKHQPCYLK